MTKWYKSKTMLSAVGVAILGVVELNFEVLMPLLGDYYGLSWLAFSALMVGLRVVTTKPLAEK